MDSYYLCHDTWVSLIYSASAYGKPANASWLIPRSAYTCLFFMQILELPQETNFCPWVICIKGQLDDEPCIIYDALLFVMGICLALYYGFGACFDRSASTVQQNSKGSIWFILGSVPRPLPSNSQTLLLSKCLVIPLLSSCDILFQVYTWWASCSYALS